MSYNCRLYDYPRNKKRNEATAKRTLDSRGARDSLGGVRTAWHRSSLARQSHSAHGFMLSRALRSHLTATHSHAMLRTSTLASRGAQTALAVGLLTAKTQKACGVAPWAFPLHGNRTIQGICHITDSHSVPRGNLIIDRSSPESGANYAQKPPCFANVEGRSGGPFRDRKWKG